MHLHRQSRYLCESPRGTRLRVPGGPSPGDDIQLPASRFGRREGIYTFSTTATGTLHLDFSQCNTPYGVLHYTLTNASTGATVKTEAVACASILVPDVPAGDYRLTIDQPGATGTYKLTSRAPDRQMVQIADEVWREWEKLREHEEPVIFLRFAPVGDLHVAAAAVHMCVKQVQNAFAARIEASDDPAPLWAGGWSSIRVSDGVLVTGEECEILDTVLPEIAKALERAGVHGTFSLWDCSFEQRPPVFAHSLECRIRVRGRRESRGAGRYRWWPDPDAHAAVLTAADQWRRLQPASTVCSLVPTRFGPIPVARDEPVADRMLESVADDMTITASRIAGDEFRSVGARAYTGGVSLIAGGPSINGGAWRAALADFKALLGELADDLVHACIKRGWSPAEALVNDSPALDWPTRPGLPSSAHSFVVQAFEDLYAPDAFGVQLLGPSYTDRLTDSPSWRRQPVGNGAVLLEHVDPDAWFIAPLVPFGEQLPPEQRPHPNVLSSARRELAPLLYTPGILHRAGYTDAPEL